MLRFFTIFRITCKVITIDKNKFKQIDKDPTMAQIYDHYLNV